MSTNFPTSLDNETVPAGSETLGGSTPPHRQVHENLKDAVQAIEAKVGVDSSAVATSLDKKVADLTTTAAAKLAKASNLSDLANVGTARTNLGLVIGTDVEAHDTDLSTLAGLSPSNDDVLQRKAGAWANRTLAQLVTDLAPLMPGYQLGSGACTTDFSTTSTTRVDVTGLTTGAITVGVRPVLVILNVLVYHSVDQGVCCITIDEDGTAIAVHNANLASASGFASVTVVISRSPSAGSHTYKGQLHVGSGTGHVFGGVAPPTYSTIRVLNI